MKQGFSREAMEPWAPLLRDLLSAGGRLLQLRGEEAMDIVNKNRNGSLKIAAKKLKERYETWRKELVTVVRVMLSHVHIKKRYYDTAVNAKEPAAWLQELMDMMSAGDVEVVKPNWANMI